MIGRTDPRVIALFLSPPGVADPDAFDVRPPPPRQRVLVHQPEPERIERRWTHQVRGATPEGWRSLGGPEMALAPDGTVWRWENPPRWRRLLWAARARWRRVPHMSHEVLPPVEVAP